MYMYAQIGKDRQSRRNICPDIMKNTALAATESNHTITAPVEEAAALRVVEKKTSARCVKPPLLRKISSADEIP